MIPKTEAETPPRMWGRLIKAQLTVMRLRNTPTHVGKTLMFRPTRFGKWKHPHACGEDDSDIFKTTQRAETPPRMWGRLKASKEIVLAMGNTPTHVGKTEDMLYDADGLGKHPHACGEDDSVRVSKSHAKETPPRMWGRPY